MDERVRATDEGIDAGKDAEDPWEKPNLRLGSWVSMTSFVSHAAPFEDRRGAAEQTEPSQHDPTSICDVLRNGFPVCHVHAGIVALKGGGGTQTPQTSDGSQLLFASRLKDAGDRLVRRRWASFYDDPKCRAALHFCVMFLLRCC